MDDEREFAEILVEESPDALIALSVDGIVLFWNRGAETIFGYRRDEVLGNKIDELVVPAHYLDEEHSAFARTIAQGSALFESQRRCKDGRIVDVDISMRAVNDASGKIAF